MRIFLLLLLAALLGAAPYQKPRTTETHWVPSYTTRDGRYIPGHMAKGPAHRRQSAKPPIAPVTPTPTYPGPRRVWPATPTPPIGVSIGQVFVSHSGRIYHLASCPHIRGKTDTIQMTLDQAKAKGYRACKTCKPPG